MCLVRTLICALMQNLSSCIMNVVIVVLLVIGVLIGLLATTTQNRLPPFPSVIVNIPGQGPVLGDFGTTVWNNYSYIQFRGVPYAESPSGQLRFKPAVARRPWHRILNATSFGRRCPVLTTVEKLPENAFKEDLEDCLNLCVYSRNLTGKQPVMFYIYGGGFYNGSASDHPPRHLLEKDIVLVVPHYRVGALGWLSTYSDDMPGNVAVSDLLLALEWVQTYIHVFGGDPTRVTIFGQSAGAAISGALLLSPRTPSSFFQRSIVQSGSIFASWAINRNPREQVVRVCEALECGGCADNGQLHECLVNASVLRLLQVTANESFALIVGDVNGILPREPEILLRHLNRSVPLMVGFTKHDGSFLLASYYDKVKKVAILSHMTVRQFANGIMDMIKDTTRLTNNLLTSLLFDVDLLNSNNHKMALPAYFDLTSIVVMKSPVITLAGYLIQKQLAPVYLYSFDYEGANTRFGYELGNDHYPFNGGAHHSDDNIYLFSTHSLNANDQTMAQKMVQLWTSFAMTGAPHVPGEGNILPMSSESGPYFHIDEEISIGKDVFSELTSTKDDPDNQRLDRKHVDF